MTSLLRYSVVLSLWWCFVALAMDHRIYTSTYRILSQRMCITHTYNCEKGDERRKKNTKLWKTKELTATSATAPAAAPLLLQDACMKVIKSQTLCGYQFTMRRTFKCWIFTVTHCGAFVVVVAAKAACKKSWAQTRDGTDSRMQLHNFDFDKKGASNRLIHNTRSKRD